MKKFSKHMRRHWKKYFLICILISIFAFVSAVLYIFVLTGNEPETLIKYFLGVICAELITMGGVETAGKLKGTQQTTNEEDNIV